ncbi:hypothetical protein VTI28DRAFT_1684 [Corynascus sepedonium]
MSAPSNNSNPEGQDPNRQNKQPGLWSSHAEYIKGATESAIGAVTGSPAWSASGEQDKAHARAAMQAAAERRGDPAKAGYGRAEEMAGRLTGCEGMRHEGAASRAAAKGDDNKRRD